MIQKLPNCSRAKLASLGTSFKIEGVGRVHIYEQISEVTNKEWGKREALFIMQDVEAID